MAVPSSRLETLAGNSSGGYVDDKETDISDKRAMGRPR